MSMDIGHWLIVDLWYSLVAHWYCFWTVNCSSKAQTFALWFVFLFYLLFLWKPQARTKERERERINTERPTHSVYNCWFGIGYRELTTWLIHSWLWIRFWWMVNTMHYNTIMKSALRIFYICATMIVCDFCAAVICIQQTKITRTKCALSTYIKSLYCNCSLGPS